MKGLGERTAKNSKGENYRVPADMTYKQWYEKYVKSNPEELLAEKMHCNRSADKKQFENYRAVLGKDIPETLEDFQKMKYNDNEWWNFKKGNYYIRSKLQSGDFGKIINPEKQAPHNEKTRVEGKSYLYGGNELAQELFDKYAGTGEVSKGPKGYEGINKEICIADRIIGIDYNTKKETNMFKIHHSKNRTHIVPFIPNEERMNNI